MRYNNPVLPGFHPDPSVCRVGDTFYLVTSSFHYFPGIPIWASSNLVEWKLVGHGISSHEQIDLSGTPASRGLFAPTIREHGGRFYITCTEVDRLGNFIIHAERPDGPWSRPFPVAQGGIDPSLFFDGDGTAYLCTGGEVESDFGIALSVVDPDSGEIFEGPRLINRGSGGRWPEGPHLYKRDGRYYLLLAEGGTEYGHMATIFRAASPWGPWEACPRNPILSHRDDARNPIQCVGHGDIVEDSLGNSWILCLGVRPLGPFLHNLGRETFLAPLLWNEEGWPTAGSGGRLELEMEGPLPGSKDMSSEARGVISGWCETFQWPALSPEWSFLRGKPPGMAVLQECGGFVLEGGANGLSEGKTTPAFVGRPQTAFDSTFTAILEFEPETEDAEAGITAYYDDDYHYEIFVTMRGGRRAVCLRKKVHDLVVESSPAFLPEKGKIRLEIAADRTMYSFSFEYNGSRISLGTGLTAGLCTEGTWRQTFTGVFFGLYCRQGRAFFFKASCVDSRGGR